MDTVSLTTAIFYFNVGVRQLENSDMPEGTDAPADGCMTECQAQKFKVREERSHFTSESAAACHMTDQGAKYTHK